MSRVSRVRVRLVLGLGSDFRVIGLTLGLLLCPWRPLIDVCRQIAFMITPEYIATNVSACVFVHETTTITHEPFVTNLYACCLSPCLGPPMDGSVTIRCALPVLWITLCSPLMGPAAA